jgi:hypothetical protein
MKKALIVIAVILFVIAVTLSVSSEGNQWNGHSWCSGSGNNGHHFGGGGHHPSNNPKPPMPPAQPADPKGRNGSGSSGKGK